MPYIHGATHRPGQQGFILMITIIAMMVALIILVPVLSFVSTTHLTTVKTLERWESYLTRESGVEYGITKLKNDRNLLNSLSNAPLVPVPLPLPPVPTNEQTVTSLTATLLTPSDWDLVMAPQQPNLETALGINPDNNQSNALVNLLAYGLRLLPSETARAAITKIAPFLTQSAPAPAGPGEVDLVKTSQADFETAGSIRTNLDTSTTPGDMFLALGTPAAAYSAGPNLTAAVGAGAHAIQRSNGTFLVVRGNNSTGTNVYDPVANSFVAGPALGGNAGAGAHAVQRPNGTFLVVRGNATTGTNIYDPVANTMTTGPTLSSAAGAGAHAILRPNGTYLIFRANNFTTTFIYDPVANSFSAGPTLSLAAGAGAHSLQRPNGTFLVVRGNTSTTTFIYDPVANSFTAGPALGGNAGAGAHAIQRPNGTFLIIRGASTGTDVYDPVANTMTAGPVMTAAAGAGSHSFQRADGKFLVVRGANSTTTNIYDPVANTLVAGTALSSAAGAGSHSLQRPNGSFLIIRGNNTTTSFIYDAGWFGTGQYISEKLNPANIVSWNTIGWTQTVDNTIAFSVKTATSNAGLDSAIYRSVTSGGNISPGANEIWLQTKADYSRAIPVYTGADTNIWGSEGHTFYQRTFPRPDVQDITLNYTVTPNTPSSLVQYKSDGSTVISTGSYTNETTVVFKFSMSSPALTDTLTPQVEIRPLGTGFTNSPTNFGTALGYSGSTLTGTVTISGLTQGVDYHWQARVGGISGNSSWASYGGNPEANLDLGTQTSASIGKTVVPGTVSAVDPVTYTITITNTGAGAAKVTSITDTLAAGFTYVTGSTTGVTTANPSVAGQLLTWTVSSAIAFGSPVTLSFQATAPTTAGTFNNNASVLGDNFTTSSTGSTAPVVVNTPTVFISKTVLPGMVDAGDNVTYTITVSNSGLGTARVTAITDTLAAGFSYVTGSTTGTTTADPSIVGQTLTWNLTRNVTSGSPLTLSFQATSSLTGGTYNDNASVQGNNFTTLATGDTAPVIVNAPIVAISKTVPPETVAPGDAVTYTVTVSNSGVGVARVTGIIDTLASGFAYVPGSTTGITTADPSIIGQTLTWSTSQNVTSTPLTLIFQATTSSTEGTYNNDASVQGSNFTTVNTGNTAPVVVANPTVSIAKIVDPASVYGGDNVTYTITVSNTSGGPARLTSIDDTLATDFTYITGSTSGTTTADPSFAGQTLTWNLTRTITSGSNITLSFTANTPGTIGTYNNNASASGSNFTTVSTGNTAPVTVNPPPPAPGTLNLYKTSQADFEAAGSIRTNLDTSTTPGDMILTLGGTPDAVYSAGPTLTAAVGAGAHAIQRPDGTFLVVRGAGTTTTYVYDPVANSFTAGPVLGGNAGAGAHAILRPNGTFLIVRGNNSTGTNIYDPVANSMIAGPTFANAVSTGGHALQRPNGTFLVVRGAGTTTTYVYDPVANSFTAGPVLGGNAGAGAHAIQRPNGTFLIVRGNNSTGTDIYDPVANTMIAGPTFASAVNTGGHALQRPDGKFLIVRGNNQTTTFIYDPVANSFTAGPVLGGNAGAGAHSFQRSDGTFLIIRGNNTTGTNIYDPVANTMAAGPTLATAVNTGGYALQRPDGTFLIFRGSAGTSTFIYNAGWFATGQYVSEKLSPADIISWNTIAWTQTADNTIAFSVKTATSNAGLDSAIYRSVTNGGNINPTVGEVWLQMKADYSRAIPSYPGADTNVWGGESHTFYQRTFALPDVQDITLNYAVSPNSPTALAQYKSDGTTVIASGGYTNETSVVVKFSMSSPAQADSLTPQVEVQPIGANFTNSPTGSGNPVAYSGIPVTGSVTVSGLTQGTDYHWQARISKGAGNGPWVSYGGNPEANTDFGTFTAVTIGKTVIPGTVNAGQPVTYSITVTNTGAGTAKVTAIADTLPSGFTYVPGSTTGTTTADPSIVGQTLTWTLSRNVNTVTPLTLSFQATASSSAGTYYNNASVQGSNFNTASTGNTAPVVVTTFVVSLSKIVSPGAVTGGDPVTYTITVSVAGAGTANVTAINDTLPTGFSYLAGSTTGTTTADPSIAGQNLTWSLSRNVTSGSPVTLSFQATSSSVAGTYNNNSSVQGSNFTTVSTGNTAPVTVSIPDVTISKTVDPTSVFSGDPVTYTMQIINNGNGTAKVTAITDTLPAGFTYVPGSTTGDFTTTDPAIVGQTLTWNVSKNVNTPQPQLHNFQATTSGPDGTYYNNASIQGSNFSTVSTGNTAPVVLAQRVVTITKTVTPDSVFMGDNVTYTITVANSGGASVQLTSITDTLAAGFVYVPGSTTGTTTANPSIAGQTLTWTITRTIAASSNITLSFSGTVPDVEADFNNNASAVGSNFPVVSTGNTAQVRVNAPQARIIVSEATGNTSGPPGWTNVNVTGYTFDPQKSVIIYWVDLNNPLNPTTDPPTGTALTGVITTLAGSFRPLSFNPVSITIPANVNWGNGFVVAVMEKSAGTWIEQDRKPFNVRAKYEIVSQTTDGITLTARVAFTGRRSPDGAQSTPTNTPLITIYMWKE